MTDFVVRNIPATGLDGAFRIHLAPESIQQVGLTFNEPCQILDQDGKVIGCGISWRAADKMGASPKMRPARMSETLREAFGIKEGSHVTLQPTKSGIVEAERIVLVDVTPAELDSGNQSAVENKRWRSRCVTALCNAEAVATGMTFEVAAKRGLKKRFAIDSVGNRSVQPGVPQLYYFTDDTDLSISDTADGLRSPTGTFTQGLHYEPLPTDSIGGLLSQLETLNKAMKDVLEQTNSTRRSRGVLIHGYEGTGKSMLLKQMEKTNFRKILRLDQSTLQASTAAKKQTVIASVFDEAKVSEPSLILIDNLDRLAPASEDLHATSICDGLDKIARSSVLVIAATRSPNNVDASLRRAGRLKKGLELPIPDLNAREEILSALMHEAPHEITSMARVYATRTHGYTGSDLALLIDLASVTAKDEYDEQEDEYINVTNGAGSRDQPTDGTPVAETNSLRSRSTSARTNERSQESYLTTQTLDTTLSEIRPSALREIIFEPPQLDWSDIGGSSSLKARFDKAIGQPAQHTDTLSRYHLPAPKGMLLYGPPGCSKTLTAQAVASTYDMNFIPVKGAELVSMYVGESERAVRETFRKARTARPCVIFFDEIDSIASERESSGTKGLNVLTTLLNEMDGFERLTGVFVLAATNKPEALDPAIMRAGRFDSHLYLAPPDADARRDIIDLQMRRRPKDGELEVEKLVEATEGCSGAEIVQLCNEATSVAVDREISTEGRECGVRAGDFDEVLPDLRKRITPEMLRAYETFAAGG